MEAFNKNEHNQLLSAFNRHCLNFQNSKRIEPFKNLGHDEHNSIVVKELATELGYAFCYLLIVNSA